METHAEPRELAIDAFRVLVVDDEERVLTEIDRQLRDYNVERCRPRALRKLSASSPTRNRCGDRRHPTPW